MLKKKIVYLTKLITYLIKFSLSLFFSLENAIDMYLSQIYYIWLRLDDLLLTSLIKINFNLDSIYSFIFF